MAYEEYFLLLPRDIFLGSVSREAVYFYGAMKFVATTNIGIKYPDIYANFGVSRSMARKRMAELEKAGWIFTDPDGTITITNEKGVRPPAPMPDEIKPAEQPAPKKERPRGISRHLRFKILRRDKFTCTYCGTKGKELHVDHIHPKSAGGGNNPENLTTACVDCNLGKFTTILEPQHA